MTATNPTQNCYRPIHKPNQLLSGTGQVAVVTGWTVKQAIAKHLHQDEYAVIGQLYSPTRGINLLIRNLLANPHVCFLVVLNATKEDKNAGAGKCLLDFFEQGFQEGKSDIGKPCWAICSEIPGYIDIEVDRNALEQLRQSLAVKEVFSIHDAIVETRNFASLTKQPWGTPLDFPLASVMPTVLPGNLYGHRIEGKTIAETWVKIIQQIKTTGTIRPTNYDGQWQELIDLMAIVTDEPEDFYFPEPNYLPCDRAFIQQYISQVLDDAPRQEGVKYTYGQRLRSHFGLDQIEQVINKLVADIDSARAVMSLWDVQDGEANNSPPCLNHIWVRVAAGFQNPSVRELSLTATFRSNDMFSAWVANVMGLRALQQHIRDEIEIRSQHKLKLGALITISQSAHIYDDCWENAELLIQSQYSKIFAARDYADPAGSFVINVQDNQIFVEHMTPGSGEVVNCYFGRSAMQIYRQIAADCPSLQVEHAMYLGSELQKAEMALSMKKGDIYQQDKPLKLN